MTLAGHRAAVSGAGSQQWGTSHWTHTRLAPASSSWGFIFPAARLGQAVGARWSANHGAICELNEANTFRRGSSPNGFDQVWGGSTMGRNTMVRSLILTAVLTMGVSTIASAGVTPHPIGNSDGLLTRVAEGCGPGWWRGPGGRCHPMARGRACPREYHLGPEGGRCWPN